MKWIRTAALLLVALGICRSADGASVDWFSKLSVAPFAALQTESINGKTKLGGGVDVGFRFNDTFSLHAAALTYEDSNWRGGVVDEVEAYGKAKVFTWKALSLTGKGGAVYDPALEDYALAVGAGLEIHLSDRVAIGADYTVRAWIQERDKDSLLRAFVQLSF